MRKWTVVSLLIIGTLLSGCIGYGGGGGRDWRGGGGFYHSHDWR
jgi:hypothetical protein